jgi:hypothetical protein
MARYRISVALLSGLGFVSLVCLLLNLPVANFLLLVVFIPGATVLSMLSNLAKDSIPNLLIMNVVVYSVLALVMIFLRFRSVQLARLRQTAIWMVLPVTVMSCLVFFTSLNPLLPAGIDELSRQELGLQQALPLGISLEEARSILKGKGIQFHESLFTTETVLLMAPIGKVTAEAGDRLLFSRFRTHASSYPCVYDMQIDLLFG